MYTYTHIYIHVLIYIYIYECVLTSDTPNKLRSLASEIANQIVEENSPLD